MEKVGENLAFKNKVKIFFIITDGQIPSIDYFLNFHENLRSTLFIKKKNKKRGRQKIILSIALIDNFSR